MTDMNKFSKRLQESMKKLPLPLGVHKNSETTFIWFKNNESALSFEGFHVQEALTSEWS